VRFAIRKRRLVSESLSHALEQVDDRLVRGLEQAERELAETRERCERLERDVRTLRAALEPSVLAADTVEPMLDVIVIDDAPVAIASAPALEPSPAPAPEPAPVSRSEREPTTAVRAAATPEQAPRTPDEPTPFAEYMPMLQELWEIANREEPATPEA
jgi:hypothetical protein